MPQFSLTPPASATPPMTPGNAAKMKDLYADDAGPAFSLTPPKASGNPTFSLKPPKDEGVLAEVGQREGRQLKEIGQDVRKQIQTPFKKDATAGPELLQRIGSAGAKVANVGMDALSAPFTPFQSGLETGTHRVLKGQGVKDNPETEKAIQDAAGLVTGAAFAPGGKVAGAKALTATDQAAGALDKAAQPVRKLFAPSTVSPMAQRTAAVKRAAVGEATRDTKASVEAIAPYEKMFDAMTPAQKIDFSKLMENRSNPQALAAAPKEWQDAAKILNTGYEMRAGKLKNTKSLKDVGLIDDYLSRNAVWDNNAKRQQFTTMLFGKQGKGGNLQARKYPTYEEFVKAVQATGGRLVDENFGRSAALYYANMDKYIAHNRAFDLLRDDRLIKYGPEHGKGRVPDGWVPLKGRLAVKDVVTKKGEHFRTQAYAPADVARVYNNFISRDMLTQPGNGVQKTRQVLNTVTAMKMGLTNMWHAGEVASGAVSRDLVKGTRQLLTPGTRVEGLKSIAKAPLAPERLARVGQKYHDQYLRLTNDPQAEKLVQLATKANTIQTKRPSYMDMVGPKVYNHVLNPGNLNVLDPAAYRVGRQVSNVMQKLTSPMFDKWIPEMKTGATIERLKLWLEQHPNSTPAEQEAYARALGDSIDNSFGEMMQDNLFWHKTLRNALQTGLISFSWVAGFTRMFAGAAKEGYQTARSGKELGPNAEYLIANAVTAALASSVYQYLHTGKAPQQPLDLLWPQTGGTQHVGNATVPERASIPTGHWNQFAEYMHDPLQELANEGSIGAKVFLDLLNNKDYRGMPIAKPWAAWSDDFTGEAGDAVWRYAKFIGGDALTPMALDSYMRRNAGTGINPAETIGLAARPAPAFLSGPQQVKSLEHHGAQKEWQRKLKSDRKLSGRREMNQKPKAFSLQPPEHEPLRVTITPQDKP